AHRRGARHGSGAGARRLRAGRAGHPARRPPCRPGLARGRLPAAHRPGTRARLLLRTARRDPPPGGALMRLLAKLSLVELKLFVREPISLVFTFAFPLVVLVVLFGVFGDQPAYAFNYARPNDYYLASYVSVVIAAVSLVALPVHVASYRERGVLRRLRASSVPGVAVLTAQVLVALVLVTLGSLVLIVAGIVGYDADLPDQLQPTLVGFALSALAFLAVGFFLGNVARTSRAAQAI